VYLYYYTKLPGELYISKLPGELYTSTKLPGELYISPLLILSLKVMEKQTGTSVAELLNCPQPVVVSTQYETVAGYAGLDSPRLTAFTHLKTNRTYLEVGLFTYTTVYIYIEISVYI